MARTESESEHEHVSDSDDCESEDEIPPLMPNVAFGCRDSDLVASSDSESECEYTLDSDCDSAGEITPLTPTVVDGGCDLDADFDEHPKPLLASRDVIACHDTCSDTELGSNDDKEDCQHLNRRYDSARDDVDGCDFDMSPLGFKFGDDFDPLEVEPKDANDQDSPIGEQLPLMGHVEDFCAVDTRVAEHHNSSIDRTNDKPNLQHEEINISSATEETAFLRDATLVIETRQDPLPSVDGFGPLRAPHIDRAICMPRTLCGGHNAMCLDTNPHHEISSKNIDDFKDKAGKLGIVIEDDFPIGKGTSVGAPGGQNFYVSLEDDELKDYMLGLGLREVFNDLIVKPHPKDTDKLLVAKRNSRGNRGPSIGFAGDHSTKKTDSGVAVPNVVKGTQRLAPIAAKMSKLAKLMWERSAFSEKPMCDETVFPTRQQSFAETIHRDNMFESVSVLFLLHQDGSSMVGPDFLKCHADRHNCPFWKVLSGAWDAFFDTNTNMFVTGIVTACWKDSVSNHYRRQKVVGAVVDFLTTKHLNAPLHQREVTKESLCQREGSYRVANIHYDPLVHLSPLTFSIDRLRSFLRDNLGTKMSWFLMVEMAVAGVVKSNNMCRCHLFAEEHYHGWVHLKRDPLPRGQTFLGTFQDWLRVKHNSYDGNQTLGGQTEGALRHQATNGSPIMETRDELSLNALATIMLRIAGNHVTGRGHRETVLLLNSRVMGASVLTIQKIMYVMASLDDQFDI